MPGSTRALVDLLGGALDLEEPGTAHRGGAGGDLFGAFDHRVDRPVVELVSLEGVGVDHPPATPPRLAGAHHPRGLEDLSVGEVVPVPFEVLG